MDILMQEPEGSFVVRDSASNPGCLALSVKNSDGNILHFLIIRDHQGWYLQVSSSSSSSSSSSIALLSRLLTLSQCRVPTSTTQTSPPSSSIMLPMWTTSPAVSLLELPIFSLTPSHQQHQDPRTQPPLLVTTVTWMMKKCTTILLS